MQGHQYRTIDPLVLLHAVGNDAGAFRELSQTFLRITPPMLARLEKALAARDSANVVLEAHTLKGTTALVGAACATRLAHEIEALSRGGDADGAARLLPALATEFALVAREVLRSVEHSLAAAAAAPDGRCHPGGR